MRTIRAGIVAALTAGLVFQFPAVAQEVETLTLPAGSMLHVRLETTLSTRYNKNGDPFKGRVIEPVLYEDKEVVQAGSIVEGRVTFVKQPGRVKGVGEMRLLPEALTTPEEVRYSLVAGLEDARGAEGARVKDEEGTIKGPSSKKGDIAAVAAGTGIGAGVGAIGAGGSGALYGMGIGAAVFGIRSLFKRGKDIILPQGTELTFVVHRTTTAQRVVEPEEEEVQRR
jgi:type IV secretion system protein VirB10